MARHTRQRHIRKAARARHGALPYSTQIGNTHTMYYRGLREETAQIDSIEQHTLELILLNVLINHHSC